MMKTTFLISIACLLSVAPVMAKGDRVTITWGRKGANVKAPKLDSLTYTVDRGHVTVNNTYRDRKLTFVLTGRTDDGSLRYKGHRKTEFEVSNLTLTSHDSIPLNLKNSKQTTLVLTGRNVLTVAADTLDAGMITSKGTLRLKGDGSLTLKSSAVGCKGIKANNDLVVDGGDISIETTGMYVEVDTAAQFGPMQFGEGKFPGPPPGMFQHEGDSSVNRRPHFPGPPPGMRGEAGDTIVGGHPQFGPPPGFGDGHFPTPPQGADGTMGLPPGGKQKYNGSTKGIRVKGTITINGGRLTIKTATPGAEGLEGKTSVVINGGEVDVDAFDDGINSGGPIVFNGGNVRVVSHDNDAVDSNSGSGEAIVIRGGNTVATSLKGSPEEGMDCDFVPIIVEGGTAFAIGGAMGPSPSAPNENTAKQPTLMVSGFSVTKGDTISVLTESGTPIVSYVAPADMRDAHALITSPQLQLSSTYLLKIGDKQVSSFNITKKVTNVR